MAVSIFLIHCFLDNVWVLLNLFELPRGIISILLRSGSSKVDLGPARQSSTGYVLCTRPSGEMWSLIIWMSLTWL